MKSFLSVKFISGILAVAVLGGGWAFFKNGNGKLQTLAVQASDFVQEVSVSGRVVAAEKLDLSFEQGGRISGIKIKTGDKVTVGQVLATQDITQLNAQLAEMRAGIDVQKARLAQLLAGASLEDIQVFETAVVNAHKSVDSAKQALIDELRSSYTKSDDAIQGKADQMFEDAQTGSPKLKDFVVDASLESEIEFQRLIMTDMFRTWGMSLAALTAQGDLIASLSEAKRNLTTVKAFLDKLSLAVNNSNAIYIVNGTSQEVPVVWKTDTATARTSINAAISALTTAEEKIKNAESSLKTAQDQLTLKKAPTRPADIALYEAQLKQAEATAQNILAQISKRQIRAPIAGTVTTVSPKVGSIVSANETVATLISEDTLQVESFVPEINISFMKIGDPAIVTLDAYGSEAPFGGEVLLIDPAETIRDGVSTYKVTFRFSASDERIKSGMTANIVVTTEKKTGVISVPQGLVISQGGRKFVNVLEGSVVTERVVQTGSISSLGQIEITSGLRPGDLLILKEGQ